MNSNINLIKGILVILLIIGHVIQQPLSNNYARYFIYIFHMPLFIGISGYLFNSNNLNFTFFQIISKYKNRILIPWFIAAILYSLIASLIEDTGIKGCVYNLLIKPYYHLWYIPALLCYILLFKFLFKTVKNKSGILIITLIVYFIFTITRYHDFFTENSIGDKILEVIVYTYKPYYFIYFVLGFFAKSITLTFNHKILYSIIPLVLISYLNWKSNIISNKIITELIIHFPINLALLLFSLYLTLNNKLIEIKLIEWLGINSLAIYLYHVLPIILLKYLIPLNMSTLFYPMVIFAEIIVLIILYFFSKNTKINKILFGIIDNNKINHAY